MVVGEGKRNPEGGKQVPYFRVCLSLMLRGHLFAFWSASQADLPQAGHKNPHNASLQGKVSKVYHDSFFLENNNNFKKCVGSLSILVKHLASPPPTTGVPPGDVANPYGVMKPLASHGALQLESPMI